MNKRTALTIVVSAVILALIVTVWLTLELGLGTPSYSYNLNVLDCDNIDYMSGCRHEIGHKMDDDLGQPSLTQDFGEEVQLYILVGLKKEPPEELALILLQHPGVYSYDETHPWMIQREVYASVYAWAEGDISKIPENLQRFYSRDEQYLKLYSCLAQAESINICYGTNFSYLQADPLARR